VGEHPQSGQPDDKPSASSGYTSAIRAAGPLFGSGVQLAASVVIMFFAGRWLDGKLGTTPWLMIIGIFFGVGAGMVNFIRIVSRVERKQSDATDSNGA
jgi:F0F1-type ATP synthase assembly protein I